MTDVTPTEVACLAARNDEVDLIVAWLESDEPQDGPTAKLYAEQIKMGVHRG